MTFSDADTVEGIIEDHLRLYGYGASIDCVNNMAADIKGLYAEVVEKAWQYDELCD